MSKLFSLVILSCFAVSCAPAEEGSAECANICDYVEMCDIADAQSQWFCTEECDDDALASTPTTEPKMALSWCTDIVKEQQYCPTVLQCIADVRSSFE